ncbi:MAG: hypothetical protein PQJ58_08895 [Spirochaetales bacterium]|nr:hypothetical protein [Spirochaetales bacterium]
MSFKSERFRIILTSLLFVPGLFLLSCENPASSNPPANNNSDDPEVIYITETGEFEEPDYNPDPRTWYISTSDALLIGSEGDAGKNLNLDTDGDGSIDVWNVSVQDSFRKVNNTDNMGISNVKPGDTILLKRGEEFYGPMILNSRGRSDQPITIGSYGNSSDPKPVIKLFDTRAEVGDNDYAVILNNPSHFIIENIRIENAFAGIYLRYEGSYEHRSITIRDCEMHNIRLEDSDVYDEWKESWKRGNEMAYPSAIAVGGRGWSDFSGPVLRDLTVERVDVTDSGTAVAIGYYWLNPSNYDYKVYNLNIDEVHCFDGTQGLLQINYVSGGTIKRSSSINTTSYNSSGIAGSFVEFCEDLVIRDNEFSGTSRVNVPDGSGGTLYTYDGAGFDFEGDCFNMVFERNLLRNNEGAGLIICHSKSGNPSTVTIRDNLFYNNSTDTDVPDRVNSGIGYLNSCFEIFIDYAAPGVSNARGSITGNKFYKHTNSFSVTGYPDIQPDYFSPATKTGFDINGNTEGIYSDGDTIGSPYNDPRNL